MLLAYYLGTNINNVSQVPMISSFKDVATCAID